ncbi:iron complex outermembrane receptor protein [Novosphingobium hassiacum]|uniref:Iron complex outermembrane receptor protein n=1 Tax=Novosphingobium hassiacum TaxID=173676 RepID=A0A7W5ZVU3_9SPHN|nr:TonB-dependent receptor [Novosphingobium hassiacum]MBB3859394.1 iron complex outermembrane receptor protein [Novosphingobium hassiacum]
MAARSMALRWFARSLIGATLAGSSYAALAQDTSTAEVIDNANTEGEIIVTAQRRAEPLQKVPISIAAFDTAALAQSHITDPRSLAIATPGLQIAGSFQFSKPVFAIRGISFKSFNATDQQAVGVYQDEVFIAARSGQLAQMYDLAGVEVLRGPQGILYGKNTTGGAINFNSAQPGDALEGHVTASAGAFSQHGIEGGITIPVDDKLSLRFAGTYDRRDGVEFNDVTNRRTYGYRTYAGRAIVRYKASDDVTIVANVHAANTNANPNYYYSRGLVPTGTGELGDINGFVANKDFFTISSPYQDERERIRQKGGILRLEADLGGASLVSVTSYDRTRYSTFEDTDASPAEVATVDYNDLSRQFSQELRLASDNDSPLSWLGGLYFFHERLTASNITAFLGGTSDQSYNQKTSDYAAFGQLTYKVSDQLSLIAGARYTYENKSISFLTVDDGVFVPLGSPTALVDAYTKRTFKAPTFKLGVNYQVDPTKLLYASFNRGFKTGGFNGTVFLPQEFSTVEPEYVNAFEIGLKSSWLNRAVTLNLAGFLNDFSDMQVFNFTDNGFPVTQVVNAASARTYGIEFDLAVRPISGMKLQLAGTLLDAKIRKVTIANLVALSGNRLPLAPRLNLTTSAQYAFTLSEGVTLTPRVEATYNSLQYFDNNEDPIASQKAFTITNAFVNFEHEGTGLTVSAYVKNLFETQYLNESVPFSPMSIYFTKHGDPRTFGVTITKAF